MGWNHFHPKSILKLQRQVTSSHHFYVWCVKWPCTITLDFKLILPRLSYDRLSHQTNVVTAPDNLLGIDIPTVSCTLRNPDWFLLGHACAMPSTNSDFVRSLHYRQHAYLTPRIMLGKLDFNYDGAGSHGNRMKRLRTLGRAIVFAVCPPQLNGEPHRDDNF